MLQTQIIPAQTGLVRTNIYDSRRFKSEFLRQQDIKEGSKRVYERSLEQFFNWNIEKGYKLSDLSRGDIVEFKDSLLNNGKSPATVGLYLTVIRQFYEFLEINDIVYKSIARGIKTPKVARGRKKEPLNLPQITKLLTYLKERSLRDYAITYLILKTSMRTIEIARAEIGDIYTVNLDDMGLVRCMKIQAKGHLEKDQVKVLTAKTWEPIRLYLETTSPYRDSDPLFISEGNRNTEGRLTTRSISRIAKEGLRAIGLDDKVFSAHSLRHTAIYFSRKAGANPEQTQAMAGHLSLATTQIYDEKFREEQRLRDPAENYIDRMY